MSEDNIKSHKKPSFYPLSGRYIFPKNKRGLVKLTAAAFLALMFSTEIQQIHRSKVKHLVNWH